MRLQDFNYDLPERLIAQYPRKRRTGSRLLRVAADGSFHEHRFDDLPALLRRGDLMVLNESRVIAARIMTRRASGGAVELMIERDIDGHDALVRLGPSRRVRPEQTLAIEGGGPILTVKERRGEFFVVRVEGSTWDEVRESFGEVPLPPYIRRPRRAADAHRYQTVYARRPGAVAAPTAGLHFDDALLDRVRRRRVGIARLTLHVGSGTFQPVRCARIDDHEMHEEYLDLGENTAKRVQRAMESGRRVVAVGTTTVRALESAADENGMVSSFTGMTRLFVYPGHRFRTVDVLITNFHLPRSTLLMMVCAFAGRERILSAYRYAVERGFRFYSYGDAMWIERPAGYRRHPAAATGVSRRAEHSRSPS